MINWFKRPQKSRDPMGQDTYDTLERIYSATCDKQRRDLAKEWEERWPEVTEDAPKEEQQG